MDSEPLKILIADDNDSDRMILQAIVRKQGHEVVTASDGIEAVEKFKDTSPQLVLMDALMPRMDGFEAARLIKQLAGEELVPIIFLTSLTDAASLVKCLDAGGDDFISKPYNRIILQAKINAFNRMRTMHRTVQFQRDQIAANNELLLQEQNVAKTVFDNVAHLGCLNAKNIKHLLSPLSVFNGDVLLACQKPSGGMHVLLGDFTGHGLPAAIGAMPIAEIFYGMTSKGFAMTDVLREINQKLKQILPVGFFCCASMIDMSFARGDVEIWVGGVPDAILYRTDGELINISSNHLPLGVLEASRFTTETYKYDMSPGDRLFMWSDGIIEARNVNGDMFGEERLYEVYQEERDPSRLFSSIKQKVHSFIGEGERDDDLTMVEVEMVREDQVGSDAGPLLLKSALSGPVDWALSYELRAQTLKNFNPLPLLLHIIMEVPGLRQLSGQIYTILAELTSNALEHGVLGLDSKLKATPEGFTKYYELRAERLEKLEDQWVRISIDHLPEGSGGLLSMKIEDSGQGFDYSNFKQAKMNNNLYSGRGIPLLISLCQHFEYIGTGNTVEAEFAWQPETKALPAI
ncbi:ATP-binding SpoIIE family protein phosphatase [Alkalimarinus alittae]|uniref:SpoIIE family protein phosphatase n=1 Tax=Alkalimarinus alittae TaxID=2961619 RepID=A0ABY6MYN3_9ALTE|nr:SpoIIE family protein phosphatase [Alkalimarinus alittae]UZE94951.1 SpoIIE family protein phosphatase [Alkalimarinus alittae]